MNSLENVVYKGKSLVVTKSSDSCTGYENVIQLRIDGKGRPLYAAVHGRRTAGAPRMGVAGGDAIARASSECDAHPCSDRAYARVCA